MRLQFDAFTGDDEKAAAEAKRVLAEGFVRWLEGHPDTKAEPFDVELLLDWKYGYGDGDFGSWSRSDVDEVLLEHLPRKLSATAAEAASIPATLGAFVRYLDDAGLLADGSDDADAVATRAVAQRQAFLDAMDDPSNWGMAKRMFAGGGLGDADELDEATIEAAMARFNALPFEERDRILGPPPDVDDGPVIALPLRVAPSDDDVEAAARDVPLLRQVEALRLALGPSGITLTDAGNPTIADARRLVAEIGTGDHVDGIRSSAELPALFSIGRVAVEAGAAAIDEQQLVSVPEWADLTGTERWEGIVEAVIDCGASRLSFGALQPMAPQLVEEANEGALHFVAMLWLADEPLPLDAFADRIYEVARHDPQVAQRPRRNLCRDRVAEVFDWLAAAGIVDRSGDTVELSAMGAHIVAPCMPLGYDVLLADDVAELDATELLDLLLERGDAPGVAAGCWSAPGDRRRRAAEMVAELVDDDDPERILLGVGVLDAFGDDAVEPLRGALDTAFAPQAWLLLVGAGAVEPDDVPTEMAIRAGIETFAGLASAGSPADVIESMLANLPVGDHAAFIDDLSGTDDPHTAEVLELIGRHHPDKAIAKHARKAAHRWRSGHAAARR